MSFNLKKFVDMFLNFCMVVFSIASDQPFVYNQCFILIETTFKFSLKNGLKNTWWRVNFSKVFGQLANVH